VFDPLAEKVRERAARGQKG